jgi:hypothetical protein
LVRQTELGKKPCKVATSEAHSPSSSHSNKAQLAFLFWQRQLLNLASVPCVGGPAKENLGLDQQRISSFQWFAATVGEVIGKLGKTEKERERETPR